MIYLVSGPTSCGKSTFIEKCPRNRIGIPKDVPVFFPKQVLEGAPMYAYNDVIVHYNILRLYPILGKAMQEKIRCLYKKMTFFLKRQKGANFLWSELLKKWDYQQDPFITFLFNNNFAIKAIVLVANKDLIRQRMQKRLFVEADSKKPYPRTYWVSVLEQVNLLDIYNIWINFLQQNKIEYKLYNSNTMEYEELGVEEISKILYGNYSI
jgi:hypothetical protein